VPAYGEGVRTMGTEKDVATLACRFESCPSPFFQWQPSALRAGTERRYGHGRVREPRLT